jgi:general secretion pathway protein N
LIGSAVAGALAGALVAALAYAPAAWLAAAVAAGSGERLVLADARGTVWSGSATPVLTGGPGSRDASALPGRLHWKLRLAGLALRLDAEHACCINGTLRLRIVPGFGGTRVELLPAAAGQALGQWPAAWLVGLGTPWNTLAPSGSLQLASPGFALQQVGGAWRLNGRADIELNAFASRISTLDVLGSYRLSVSGDAASGQPATIQLSTTSGALQLSGTGQWLGAGAASQLRFRGSASAAPGQEAVLNNVLNIIGRRQGPAAIISIG